MQTLECNYEPPHVHEFPDDWEFGGATGADPRTDARWLPDSYIYLDDHLHPVHHTSAPLCDDQAIDEFTLVASWGMRPVYLQVRRAVGGIETIAVRYDESSDLVVNL